MGCSKHTFSSSSALAFCPTLRVGLLSLWSSLPDKSVLAWSLGPYQIIYANNVIMGCGVCIPMCPMTPRLSDLTQLWASLVGNTAHALSHLVSGKIKHFMCDFTGWEFKACPGFSWTPSCVLFPLADFNMYPFAVINCNHEYNCFSELCESY